MRCACFVFASLAAAAAHAGGQRHAVTLSDLQQISIPDVTFSLSPDGKRLAYAIANESVWIVDVKPDAKAQQIGRGFLPAWSPAGDRVAFYSTKADGPQLWRFDVKSSRASQLTRIAGGIDPDPTSRMVGWVRDAFRYSWSPDGKAIVFASRVPDAAGKAEAPAQGERDKNAPLVLTNTTPAEWTLDGVFSQSGYLRAGAIESKDGYSVTAKPDEPRAPLSSELFLVYASTGAVRQLTHGATGAFNPAWSPDGSAILAAASDASGAAIDAAAINIYSIDPRTGERAAITKGAGIRYQPRWSSDGARLAFLYCEKLFDLASLVVADPRGEQSKNVTRALDRHVLGYAWQGTDALLIQHQDGVSMPLSRLALASGEIVPVPRDVDSLVPREVSDVAASSTGTVVWSQSDPAKPGVIAAATADHPRPFELLDLYPKAREFETGRVEVVHWKNQRGEALEGTLLKPPHFRRGKKYPLIVDVYPLIGGDHWASAMGSNYAWASAGYAVFRPSPRAPHVWVNPWKGATSTLAAKGAHGWDVTFDDVESGVDRIIADGVADPKRMCLYGFSNGGSVVDEMVTRTNRYQCAISVAPALADWTTAALLDTDSSWVSTTAGFSAWDDPAGYVALSPVLRANRVKTPMLLAVGDLDTHCLLDSIEMYNGVRRTGTAVTLVRYPGQGHGFGGAALEDFWQREMEFFGTHLKR